MSLTARLAGLPLAFLLATTLLAQAPPSPAKFMTQNELHDAIEHAPLTTFYLSNTSQPNESNEVVTAIRNMVSPVDHVYLVNSRNAIIMRALPEDIDLARKLIADLDHPRHSFRLTYTITESDAGKRIGVQHVSAVIAPGSKTELKQGSRVPISSRSRTGAGSVDSQNEIVYIDIGLNLEAALDQSTDNLNLRSKIEQSSLAEERSGFGTADPVIRQSVLEGTASLTLGKPLALGGLDIPGSTRHLDIEVTLDPIR